MFVQSKSKDMRRIWQGLCTWAGSSPMLLPREWWWALLRVLWGRGRSLPRWPNRNEPQSVQSYSRVWDGDTATTGAGAKRAQVPLLLLLLLELLLALLPRSVAAAAAIVTAIQPKPTLLNKMQTKQSPQTDIDIVANCEAGPLNPKLIEVHHAHHDRQRWTHSSHSFALNRSAQNSTRPSKMAPMTSSVIAYWAYGDEYVFLHKKTTPTATCAAFASDAERLPQWFISAP